MRQKLYKICVCRPLTILKNLRASEKASTVFESMINGGSVSSGKAQMPTMLKLWITISKKVRKYAYS